MQCIDSRQMGKSEMGWLHSTFHFSFAEYYRADNVQFGALRVVNDDRFDPHSGFATHPHENMEIISYVVDGVLTHRDSMGNRRELTRGQVQYMSAGTGVTHSEHNLTDQPLRFLQIWVLPDREGHAPQYGDYRFDWAARENKWLKLASGRTGNAPIILHQDVEVSVISMEAGSQQTYALAAGRKAYLIQIEGNGAVNGRHLAQQDAAQCTEAGDICLFAAAQSHYILFDLAA